MWSWINWADGTLIGFTRVWMINLIHEFYLRRREFKLQVQLQELKNQLEALHAKTK